MVSLTFAETQNTKMS